MIAGNRVVEVETETTGADGLRQLQGYQRPVYLQGANAAATERALDVTKGTTVGVMNDKGEVVKRSTRKRR